MSLENIVQKIRSEAEDTVRVIDGKAQEDIEKLQARLDAEEKDLSEDAKKMAEAEAEEVVRRRTSSARLEGRKRVLAAKESVLNQAFAIAKSRLLELPDEELVKALTPGE